MSLIKQKQIEVLTNFYKQEIVPLSNIYADSILDYACPDSNESYFIKRSNTRMTKQDFELKLADEQQAAKTIDSKWAATPLKGLGKKMLKLTPYFLKVKEKSELSSSIYEMF
jgi:hypothetical protein